MSIKRTSSGGNFSKKPKGTTRYELHVYFRLASEQMVLLRKVYARRAAEAAKEQGKDSEE